MITAVFAYPVLSSLTDLILTCLETAKARVSLSATKYGQKAQKILMELEDVGPAHQIGFVIDDEQEGYEDEDEDL